MKHLIGKEPPYPTLSFFYKHSVCVCNKRSPIVHPQYIATPVSVFFSVCIYTYHQHHGSHDTTNKMYAFPMLLCGVQTFNISTSVFKKDGPCGCLYFLDVCFVFDVLHCQNMSLMAILCLSYTYFGKCIMKVFILRVLFYSKNK